MKYILAALLMIVGHVVQAQQLPVNQVPTQFSTGYFKQGWHKADSGHVFAVRDTNFTPRYAGTTILWQNSGVDTAQWIWTGVRWIKNITTITPSPTVWGSITGTLSNQTDLQSALDTKLNISDTTDKWVYDIYRRGDSVFYSKGGDEVFAYIDSTSGGGGSGTVTSVDLSMPSAFSVSGNPITSSGMINVSGAGTTLQYIRGNGTLATMDTSAIPSFYLKTRSLFSGTSPLQYNSTTGAFSILDATTTQKGVASFNASDFDVSSASVSLKDVVAGGSCTNCDITFDNKGRAIAFNNGASTGITSLNGLTASVQLFAFGSSGTTPNFVSSVGTHTLNIPLANQSGVTSGTITKTEYDIFNNKLGGVQNIGTGYRWVVPPTGATANTRSVYDSPSIIWDSISNTNGLTAKVDTTRSTGIPSYYYVDSIAGTAITSIKNGGDGYRIAYTADSLRSLKFAGNWGFLDTVGTPGVIRIGITPQVGWGLNVDGFTDEVYADSSKVAPLFALQDTTRNIRASTWSTTGNTGTNSTDNFIGTIDNAGFSIRTNNTQRLHVGATSLLHELRPNGLRITNGGISLYSGEPSMGEILFGATGGIRSTSTNTTARDVITITPGNFQHTTGSMSGVFIGGQLLPTTGTGVTNFFTIGGLINQGTGTGAVRGLYISQTIGGGGAADYRALEIASGRSVFRDSIVAMKTPAGDSDDSVLVKGSDGLVKAIAQSDISGGGGSADSSTFSTNFRRDSAIANVRSEIEDIASSETSFYNAEGTGDTLLVGVSPTEAYMKTIKVTAGNSATVQANHTDSTLDFNVSAKNLSNSVLRPDDDYVHYWNSKVLIFDSISYNSITARNVYSTGGMDYWQRGNLNLFPGGFSGSTFSHTWRTYNNSSDSLNNNINLGTQNKGIEIYTKRTALTKEARISLYHGGNAGIPTIDFTADSVRTSAISASDADSIFAPGPWNPATRTNSILKIPKPAGGGGGGSPAGSNTYVQYNNSGSFGAEADFTYNASTNTLSVPKVMAPSSNDMSIFAPSSQKVSIGVNTTEYLSVGSTGAITFGTGSETYNFPFFRPSAGHVLTGGNGSGGLSWSYPHRLIAAGTTTSGSTITPDADANGFFTITALATNPTIAAPSGLPTDGQTLLIRIKDNGSSRTITWNAIYRAGTDFALPTATVAGETMYIQFIYNSADSKWDAVGLTQGF